MLPLAKQEWTEAAVQHWRRAIGGDQDAFIDAIILQAFALHDSVAPCGEPSNDDWILTFAE